jgi:hypothetical protein
MTEARAVKDQYVGDINDFAKYQLLRLAEAHFERVLVAWMLTDADGRNDGGQITYLDDPGNGASDPELFGTLAKLVRDGERSVAAIESSGALAGCEFHSTPMPRDGTERARYFAELVAAVDRGSLVFLDPDNGMEVASVARGANGAERYLYWGELAPLRDAGSSVLVYQHFPRVQRTPYLEGLFTRMGEEMGSDYETFAAYTSRVGFLFALREEHSAMRDVVAKRCERSPLLSFHGR